MSWLTAVEEGTTCMCFLSDFCCGCCNVIGIGKGHKSHMLGTDSSRSVSMFPPRFSDSFCVS